ncbi:MAG: hypothetical protein AAGD32_16445, partial [Planctomycetota bacterium]
EPGELLETVGLGAQEAGELRCAVADRLGSVVELAFQYIAALLLMPFLLGPRTASADIVIDVSDANDLKLVRNADELASSRVVAVQGQPFDNAIRVHVFEATDPPWAVQVFSPNIDVAVKRGDVLEGEFHYRAEAVGDSTPKFAGFLRTEANGFEQLAWLGADPTEDWNKIMFRIVAERDFEPGEIAVNFHLGVAAQIVELGGLTIDHQPIAGDAEGSGTDKPEPPISDKADEELEALVGDAPMVIAGNGAEALNGPGASPDASLSIVDVEGQAFTKALRVAVAGPIDPIWDAQIASPNSTAAINAGDVLFGYFDIRADSENGKVVGWLQANDDGWEGLHNMDFAPDTEWTRHYFAVTVKRDYPADAINLTFQLGTVAQTVDVANIVIWNLGPDADIDALPKTK